MVTALDTSMNSISLKYDPLLDRLADITHPLRHHVIYFLGIQDQVALLTTSKKWRDYVVSAQLSKSNNILQFALEIVTKHSPEHVIFNLLHTQIKTENQNNEYPLTLRDPLHRLKLIRFHVVQIWKNDKLPERLLHLNLQYVQKFLELHKLQRRFEKALIKKVKLLSRLKKFADLGEYDFFLQGIDQIKLAGIPNYWELINLKASEAAGKNHLDHALAIAKTIPLQQNSTAVIGNIFEYFVRQGLADEQKNRTNTVLIYLEKMIPDAAEPQKSWFLAEKIRYLLRINQTEFVEKIANTISNPLAHSHATKRIARYLARKGQEQQAIAIAKTLENPNSQEELMVDIQECLQERKDNKDQKEVSPSSMNFSPI